MSIGALKYKIINMNLTRYILIIIQYMFRVFKIKQNKVLCQNFGGKGFGDNPKYIVQELIKLNKFDIVWVVKNIDHSKFPKEVRLVKKYTLRYFYELATSKVWISNNRLDRYIIKRKNQFYIQVWHGSVALKKIEFDVEQKLGHKYIEAAKHDNKMIDCMISSSKFCTDVMYRGAFKFDKKIYEFGIPRNDILIHSDEHLIKKVKNYFGLKNEKIVLYVPTFRNNYSNQYNIDFASLIATLNNKYKNEWKVLLRLHPNVINKPEEYGIIFNNDVLNATFYDDIQELIIVSDLIITDYSSLMFEGIIAKKPVLLYTTDIETYNDERGTYFSFDDLPFKRSNNNKDLINVIENESFNNMMKDYDLFSKKIGFYVQGNASYEVAKIIENKIYGDKNDEVSRKI